MGDHPMQELGLSPLVNGAFTSLSHSARPDSPVAPDRPPGRLRLLAADALHRLASRLDRGQLAPLGTAGRPLRAGPHA
jgi:hypothetical protein